MKPRSYLPLLIAAAVLAGCRPGAELTAPEPAFDHGVLFLGAVFTFQFVGTNPPDDGFEWRGGRNLADAEGSLVGSLEVLTTSAVQEGETLHLLQTWTLLVDGEDPVALEMMGILNLANGRLVLNGIPPEPGQEEQPPPDNGHVLADVTFNTDGTIDVLGELMQPPPTGDTT